MCSSSTWLGGDYLEFVMVGIRKNRAVMEKLGRAHSVSSNTRNACAMIHPGLIPFVEHCLSNPTLNTQGGILEVSKPKSSCLGYENERMCDRFTVTIPYCGTQLSWEVVFDHRHLGEPPDIIFSAEDEEMTFDPDIEKFTSLSRWSHRNPHCLGNLLEELLTEYRCHHRLLVDQQQRLKFELSTLEGADCFSSVDVHCSKTPDNQYFEPITRFYIQLSVDLSTIPAYLTKNNPGTDEAALLITYYPPIGSKVVPSLLLSPRVEKMLGGSGQLRLPSWGGERSSHIVDYLSVVQELLQDKVQAIVQSYIKRKECVAAFLSVFGQSVLEYDTEDFKMIAFLFELQGFSFIAKFVFSDSFPQEQPALLLQSVYHRLQSMPCQSEITDYPYSPRWSVEELVERMREYVGSVAIEFMELSKSRGECL